MNHTSRYTTPDHVYFTEQHTILHVKTHNDTMPLHTTLHYTTLHYTTLHYTTLHYTALHYTTLHCTTLHYTALHYTTLHYTTLFCYVQSFWHLSQHYLLSIIMLCFISYSILCFYCNSKFFFVLLAYCIFSLSLSLFFIISYSIHCFSLCSLSLTGSHRRIWTADIRPSYGTVRTYTRTRGPVLTGVRAVSVGVLTLL
jgi:hypothetical protein